MFLRRRVVLRRVPVANGYRSITRTRGRILVSLGTLTRVVRVPGYPDDIQSYFRA